MKTILVTGAAGGVARQARPLLRAHYRLRLSDRRPIPDLVEGETSAPADLGDLDALRAAVRGVDGILHLGGHPVESSWEVIEAANIVGCHNLFEAARLEGVKRIVFASTNPQRHLDRVPHRKGMLVADHPVLELFLPGGRAACARPGHVMGFYPRSETVGIDAPVRPDSRYGVSKAFGEALAALHAYRYGAEVLSIRIGNITAEPIDARALAIWLSPRDFVQLVRIGIEHPGIRNEIVYGMSDNARAWWDNANARRLGYRPEDRSEDFAAAVLAKEPAPSGDPRIDLNQGGKFCVAESI